MHAWVPCWLPCTSTPNTRGQRHGATWASGSLELRWTTLPPRRIALLEIPQLQVHFTYHGLDDGARYRVQKCFDLQTHRGGG
jgi:hypothetical protein